MVVKLTEKEIIEIIAEKFGTKPNYVSIGSEIRKIKHLIINDEEVPSIIANVDMVFDVGELIKISEHKKEEDNE